MVSHGRRWAAWVLTWVIVSSFHGAVLNAERDSALSYYNSDACSHARDTEQARFESHWSMSSPEWADHHDIWDRIEFSNKYRIVYIDNEKAASTSILEALEAVGGTNRRLPGVAKRLPKQYGLSSFDDLARLRDLAPSALRSAAKDSSDLRAIRKFNASEWFVFTFVREPLACAWAAYKEVSHRQGFIKKSGRSADVLRKLPCGQGDARYSAYLLALASGKPVSKQAYHAWPQVTKTGVHKTQFDFIGRIENEDDFQRLADHPKIGMLPNDKLKFLRALQTGRHMHRSQHSRSLPCDVAIAKSSSPMGLSNLTRSLACELYQSDYVCFGYSAEHTQHCEKNRAISETGRR